MRHFLSALLIAAALFAVGQAHAGTTPPRVSLSLSLSASPAIVDVGDNVVLTLTAGKWPGPALATVSFLSKHHGFTGRMVWGPSCGCFHIAVSLASRIHPLEQAKAIATVIYQRRSYTTRTTFQVRGLAKNGRDYAPGGAPYLSAWVSDPAPNSGEVEHYCAWVTTLDKLGIAGMAIRFVVHFPDRTQRWSAGKTGRTGLVCSKRSIGAAPAGKQVTVDIYAGRLHSRTAFRPRGS